MTEPTDDELDAVIAEYRTRIYPQDMHPRFERAIMRAAIAKWGTPPAVAGKPWGACVSGRVFVGGLPDHVRKLAEAENLPIQWLYTTPQPTQAQADTPCRKNPFYHGPRNCSRGTVGCCEDHGAKPQAQAGAVPLTNEQILNRENTGSNPGTAAYDLDLARFVEAAHGIKGGQHGTD